MGARHEGGLCAITERQNEKWFRCEFAVSDNLAREGIWDTYTPVVQYGSICLR
jgi:hypothetical protein